MDSQVILGIAALFVIIGFAGWQVWRSFNP